VQGEDGLRLPHAGVPLFKRIAIAGVLITFLTSGAVAAATLLKVDEIVQKVIPPSHRVHIDPKIIEPTKAGKPQTILLVGSDKRFGAGKGDARSDTMMLVRLDPKQQATAVMSIPRDLVTDIPGYGTQKINAAYSYGGLNLVLETVRQVLSGGPYAAPGNEFKINHVVGVNFRGFRRVVDFVGCVYTDVDRRYYHSNLGLPPAAQYAEIDIQPGYQKLCGQRALDYVRFRHADSDVVRAARQQGFLRNAKDQIGTSHLLSNIDPLAAAIGKSTEADANLASVPAILRILELAIQSVGHPVREIEFPHQFVNTPTESYVTANPVDIAKAVDSFLHAKALKKPPKAKAPAHPRTRKAGKRKKLTAPPPYDYAAAGLVLDRRPSEDLVTPLVAKGTVRFPLYFAKAITTTGRYPADTPESPEPRGYIIRDRAGKRHQAYRIVVIQNELEGQYYGIQGTTWKTPPILDGDSDKVRMRGRTYELHYDGTRLRTVAWRTPKAVYWVSNTLSLSLSNKQMRGIARSLTRVGSR
jgi:LCP family protein required for cell wall assembly